MGTKLKTGIKSCELSMDDNKFLKKVELGRDVGQLSKIILLTQIAIGLAIAYFLFKDGFWILAIIFILSSATSFGLWASLLLTAFFLVTKNWILFFLFLGYGITGYSWVSFGLKRAQNPDSTINSIEKTYWQFRKKQPNQDEHFYLANTLFHRYKNTRFTRDQLDTLGISDFKTRKQQHDAIELVAWAQTGQFAILDPPDSYRAMALFIIYKEFGVEAALHYEQEFNRIMSPVIEAEENGNFDRIYVEKNPNISKI